MKSERDSRSVFFPRLLIKPQHCIAFGDIKVRFSLCSPHKLTQKIGTKRVRDATSDFLFRKLFADVCAVADRLSFFFSFPFPANEF